MYSVGTMICWKFVFFEIETESSNKNWCCEQFWRILYFNFFWYINFRP